jgi:iron complex outermembrane receptor protein
MKIGLTSVSGIALLIGISGLASPAWSQTRKSSDQATQVEEIVVTGSNIRGSALDAALPVEVYSQQALEKQGSPSALEFAKSLTISGPTTGESYYFGGPALVGSVNYNLRGLGADKTLVLLNGRRMNQNTANVPSMALARTEILKDGAAVIYGADATGGVVNFITLDHFTGLQAQGPVQADRGLERRLFTGRHGRGRRGPSQPAGLGRIRAPLAAEHPGARLHQAIPDPRARATIRPPGRP